MSETRISTKQARKEYGILSRHAEMPNGELRFRLTDETGGGYIRTVATPDSGWQSAHSHKKLTEVYAVGAGWMGYCELVNDRVMLRVLQAGEIVATKPDVPHNVYLPAASVIHTIKLLSDTPNDWIAHKALDDQSKALTEEQILESSDPGPVTYRLGGDQLLKPMMDHYISLDRLLWGIPAFLFTAISITIGLLASTAGDLSKADGVIGIRIFAFAVGSILSFAGFYVIDRISYNHRLVGAEIYYISGIQYFKKRKHKLERLPWLSAQFVMKYIMLSLSLIFLVLMILDIFHPQDLNHFLFGQDSIAGDDTPRRQPSLTNELPDQATFAESE